MTTKDNPNWCSGCGDYFILTALKNAIVELNLDPHNVVITSGIGCGSKTPHWVNTYGFNSIHGRSLPVATGVRLANHGLTVINIGGDGDGYGIGMGHAVHSMRRNLDITYIVQNNQVYALTKGQTSPTSEKGFKTKSTPDGSVEDPVNPITLALTMGATFIARGFAGNLNHLQKLISAGIKHRGFALVDVLQPCVTYNYLNTYDYFKKKVYDLQEKGHDTSDFYKAYKKGLEWGNKIPIGIFYKTQKPILEDTYPQIKKIPLAKQKIDNIDISKAMEEYV